MTHNELRKKFLDFFKAKGHTALSSDHLVPAGDASVLFTSAGMNQFKEQFLGHLKGYSRATTCQKCLRTDDLKNVGVTSYHHTFFEMLGNFSFGDYFKEDAICWAWEFLTEQLKLDKNKLLVSVYKDDEESYSIWKDKIKIPKEKIMKLGDKDNFWPSDAKANGPNGPCGPCSEIFYDYGEPFGSVEVWNLVFTQFNRKEGGALEPLPNKNIDTGMGLERLCAVVEGVTNNFDTDLFKPIIAAIKNEVSNSSNIDKQKRDFHAIADHIRAVSFAISDGIVPSNEERGYVIRNLIRKSALHGKNLGAKKPFLYKLVPAVASVMQEAYPELKARRENISQLVLSEEEKFASTLEEGIRILEDEMARLSGDSKSEITGEFAFKLFDTHGFPLELAKEAASQKGFTIDEKEFDGLMTRQRDQSRKKGKIADTIFKSPLVKEKTQFIGYEKTQAQVKVLEIIKDKKPVEKLEKGERAQAVLDVSPFYGEGGGQVGDTGLLKSAKVTVKVLNAQKEANAILLDVEVESGKLSKGDTVTAQVDEERRHAVAKNHTATHLLQGALRKVLGEHVRQQGSFVEPQRLRFDFTHFKALSEDELSRVEQLVNEKINSSDAVNSEVMDIDKAKAKGALAFFGDKYDKEVRMVSLGDYSMELCGGTHVKNTKDIGIFKITSEGSVASGIRRIEAVTGSAAQGILNSQQKTLEDICALLKCSQGNAADKLKQLMTEFDDLQNKLKQTMLNEVKNSAQGLIDKAKKVNDAFFIVSKMQGAQPELLRCAVDTIRVKLKDAKWAAMLTSLNETQVFLILAASKNLSEKGFHCGKLISKIAALAGGSGGGRPDMAQAGIKDVPNIDTVLEKSEKIILEELKR